MTFPNPKRPLHWLATCFWIGLLKPGPGTWGRAFAIIIIYFVPILHSNIGITAMLTILIAFLVCILISKDIPEDDHPSIVIDEAAGVAIVLLFLNHGFYEYLTAFVIFRFFDIIKPWPISWLDRNIKGGVGIVLDDILAGIFSGIIITIFLSSQI